MGQKFEFFGGLGREKF